MSSLTMLLFALFGMFAGSLSGLLGIGGGIVIVPGLVFLFGLTQQTAQGTTMAMLVLPAGLLAAWTYNKQNRVDLRIAAFLCGGFLIGGYAGAKIATALPDSALARLFGLLLAAISIQTLLATRTRTTTAEKTQNSEESHCTATPASLALVLFGVVVGVLSGLFGVGGGALIVPGLVLLFGLTQKEAQGTALTMMVPPVGLLAALQYYQHDDVDLTVAALICAGFIVGGYFGAKFAASISNRTLTWVFGTGTFLIAMEMLIAG